MFIVIIFAEGETVHKYGSVYHDSNECQQTGEDNRSVDQCPNYHLTQNVTQISHGSALSTHNGITMISDSFAYPFALNLSYAVLPSPQNGTFFDYGVALQHSYQRAFSPGPALGGFGTDVNTVQTCEGVEVSYIHALM